MLGEDIVSDSGVDEREDETTTEESDAPSLTVPVSTSIPASTSRTITSLENATVLNVTARLPSPPKLKCNWTAEGTLFELTGGLGTFSKIPCICCLSLV